MNNEEVEQHYKVLECQIKNGFISVNNNGQIIRLKKRVGGRLGRIVALKTPMVIDKPTKNGYFQIQLYLNGKRFVYPSHRVVYFYRHGVIKDGVIIHHKNKNKLDNRIENLELKTPQEHALQHPKQPWQKIEKNQEKIKNWHQKTCKSKEERVLMLGEKAVCLLESGKTIKEISLIMNVTKRTIYERIKKFKERKFLSQE